MMLSPAPPHQDEASRFARSIRGPWSRIDLDRCGHASHEADAIRYLINSDAHRTR